MSAIELFIEFNLIDVQIDVRKRWERQRDRHELAVEVNTAESIETSDLV